MVRFFMKEAFGKDYFYGKRESNYSNYDSIDASRQFRSVVSFIKKENVRGKFLDAGCAFGLLLREVSFFFDELYGCDVSKFALEKAKQKIPQAKLRLSSIEEPLPFQNVAFDCITALDVLEHTKDLDASLGNLVKKLKKNGYLIISLPIEAWPRKLFGPLDKDKTHISVPTEAKLVTSIKKRKLKILSKKYFCPFPFLYKIPFIPVEIEMILQKITEF